ncbi:hypothetical protein JHW43_005208 [Diplocarpon mali]|nr:hypothetical protein JHW43_005208 [Diplocarpon mali]
MDQGRGSGEMGAVMFDGTEVGPRQGFQKSFGLAGSQATKHEAHGRWPWTPSPSSPDSLPPLAAYSGADVGRWADMKLFRPSSGVAAWDGSRRRVGTGHWLAWPSRVHEGHFFLLQKHSLHLRWRISQGRPVLGPRAVILPMVPSYRGPAELSLLSSEGPSPWPLLRPGTGLWTASAVSSTVVIRGNEDHRGHGAVVPCQGATGKRRCALPSSEGLSDATTEVYPPHKTMEGLQFVWPSHLSRT